MRGINDYNQGEFLKAINIDLKELDAQFEAGLSYRLSQAILSEKNEFSEYTDLLSIVDFASAKSEGSTKVTSLLWENKASHSAFQCLLRANNLQGLLFRLRYHSGESSAKAEIGGRRSREM